MTKTIPHLVNRFVVDSDDTFDRLRERYESLVPTIDFADLTDVIEAGDFAQVQRYTAEHAPHSFVNFWTLDPMPMMRLLGHRSRAITYMMGNNVIVETMYRHNAGVMLYAPLRTAIYEDGAGGVHLSIDQPSSKFASFGDSRIAEVGAQLDAKLAELLRLMSLPVPPELATA
ncbi:MAG: DUF302 domain-containing protein [Mycobacteriaceae bacterium]|nr:DUF302 domain-containing protein [Mycobacteriaceae bacterium]